MDKKASVIIPTYHSWQDLQLCLDLLAAQTTPASDFEIIVANNAVSDDVPDDFRLPPNARVIQEPKPGSYAARNAGIRAAGTDLLFFTDADCRPRSDYIAHGLKAFEAHPNVMRFAGAVELEAAGQVWTVAERVDRMMSLKQEHYATQGRAATANVFARRAAFEMVGLFDDTALSGGDMEWARRCMAQGVEQLYVPEVIVGHPARASMEAHVIKRRRILGAQIRNADPKKRWKYYIPRFKRFLLPSFGAMRIAFREPDISVSERFQMWLFLNKLRRVSAKEQMRLTWFKGKYERR